ncbi:MAG: LysR family transcriptional regulator [Patulibacter sp.]|nr:LysR family transcriptional regulator [Patulibacter sp.]
MLDVRRLRVLREVAAHGSFSAAAEALAYTQSAVSQQISALEKEAGTRLVDRGARGVTLTEAGRALVSHADAILGRLADAEAELDAISGLRRGRLRLATFATAGATVVPKAVVEFRKRYPGVELSIAPGEPPDNISALRCGDADVAIVVDAPNDRIAPEPEFETVHLLDDPMSLMLPADHPLAANEAVDLADLAEDEWILGSTERCPDARILIRTCREAGFEPRIAFQSDDHLAVQGFVASGFGVSFIPDLALVAVRDDVVVRSIIGASPVRHVHAATLAGTWASPAKQAMLAVLAEVSQGFSVPRTRVAEAA